MPLKIISKNNYTHSIFTEINNKSFHSIFKFNYLTVKCIVQPFNNCYTIFKFKQYASFFRYDFLFIF